MHINTGIESISTHKSLAWKKKLLYVKVVVSVRFQVSGGCYDNAATSFCIYLEKSPRIE